MAATAIFVVVAVVLLFVGLIVALVAAVSAAARQERARVGALNQWAMANGWTFVPRCEAPWTAQLPGRNRRGLGATLIGQVGGRRVLVAEYSYTVSSEQSSSTYHFIAVAVTLDRPHPLVSVRHASGALATFAQTLFGQRPAPIGHPVFDALYRVDSPDPGYARSLLGPQLIQAQIAGELPPWQLVGPELLTCTRVSTPIRDPYLIPAYVGPALRVVELLGR
ncbi:hypothetical protein [Nocardia macrotermitis]|uniref:Uncharacterized protein n=1 Tax=Nocardia macrotermitis TaxID=2585198 RepID=A0A7K0DHI3_9NOCA|nr:hypothetical protein [Nocardia macrotermitis]MQY24254.1 hypothetical protein [Nocardia macrotermitis]